MDRVKPFAAMEKVLRKDEVSQAQYNKDLSMLYGRVVEHLLDIGLIGSEKDIEKLALRNGAIHFKGDVTAEIAKVENAKAALERAEAVMQRERSAIQRILDKVADAELKIQSLRSENSKLVEMYVFERDRQVRNRLLINKLDNENKIQELKDAIHDVKEKHLKEFSKLETMRKQVDSLSTKLDSAREKFKQDVGLSEQAISNLMVSIYNKYQDEILSEGK